MERTLFEGTDIILTPRGSHAPYIVLGPGGVDLDAQPKGNKPAAEIDNVQKPAPQPAEVETDFAVSKEDALPADQLVAAIQSDPNRNPQQRVSRETIEFLTDVLGKDLTKHIDLANLAKSGDLDRIARVIFEKGKAQEVLALLAEAKKGLPEGSEREKAVNKIIENLAARVELDGGRVGVQSAAASSASQEFQANFQAQKTVLKEFDALLEKAQPALKEGLAKALRLVDAEFKVKLQAKRAELAEKELGAKQVENTGKRATISKLKGEIKTLEAQQNRSKKLLSLINRVKEQIETVRREGNHEGHSKFIQAIQQARTELGGKSIFEVLTTKATLSDEEIDTANRIFDENFQTTSQQGTTSGAGEAATPQSAGSGQIGISSATAPQGGTSDEPIEAVEGVKPVSANEEAEGADQGSFGIFSTDTEGHQAKVENWDNLSDGQLSMKIASAGVTMGITSSYYQSKSESKRIKKAIEKIIKAIEAGNLDAISLALILIARRSKEQLRKAALIVVQSMKYYEEQQEVINKDLAKLTGEETTYASQLQGLTGEMNRFSTNRQAAVSILRDIKGASDELDNTAKSWLDVKGPHDRALARWTA